MKKKQTRFYYKILIKGIRYFYSFIAFGILLFVILGMLIQIDGEALLFYILGGLGR